MTMEKMNKLLATVAVIALMTGIPVLAHHGTNISYDKEHPITLKGTVTEFRYANPHVQLYFDVKDDRGNVVKWTGEGTTVFNLVQAGWGRKRSEEALKPGTQITITVSPSKSGAHVGDMEKILNDKGEEIFGNAQ
jgi:hypothetical protein